MAPPRGSRRLSRDEEPELQLLTVVSSLELVVVELTLSLSPSEQSRWWWWRCGWWGWCCCCCWTSMLWSMEEEEDRGEGVSGGGNGERGVSGGTGEGSGEEGGSG